MAEPRWQRHCRAVEAQHLEHGGDSERMTTRLFIQLKRQRMQSYCAAAASKQLAQHAPHTAAPQTLNRGNVRNYGGGACGVDQQRRQLRWLGEQGGKWKVIKRGGGRQKPLFRHG